MKLTTGNHKTIMRKLLVLLVSLAFIASAVLVGTSGTVLAQTVVATVPVGDSPTAVDVNATTNRVYVTNSPDATVSVIDGATNTAVATVPVGGALWGVGVNATTNMVYVSSSNDNNVSVIDGATNAVVATVPVGTRPSGVGVSETTNMVYVTNSPDATVSVIDGATNAVVATVPVGAWPLAVGVNATTNMVYVLNNVGCNVSVIDGATNTVVATVPIDEHPFRVGVNETTNRVYVTSGDTVSVIDGATNTVVATVPVSDPGSVGVNATTNMVYVANIVDNAVSVIYDPQEPPTPTPPQPPTPTPPPTIVRQCAHASIGVTTPDTEWYIAEGATSGGYETFVLIQNPGDEAANVEVTYMTDTGAVPGPPIPPLAPDSRHTVTVGETVQTLQVSTRVTSDKPVICERATYYNNKTCATASIGVTESARNWYIAEGATAEGYETFVLIQNPGAEAANVEVTYMTDTGEVPGPPIPPIPAGSRHTVTVDETVQTIQVSTRVTSDQPVICERATYYNNKQCAHGSIGVTEPATDWFIAEGATAGGFETFVLIQNPGTETATANVTFMTDTGEVPGSPVTVGPGSRETVTVGDTVQTLQVSTRVTSDQPVICERATYYNNKTCAHASIGVTELATDWYIAEGATAGGYETFVLIQNPGDEVANVEVTFMTDTGAVPGPPIPSLASDSRHTVTVGETVQTMQVSTRVTSDKPVICERALYYGPFVQ